MQDWVPSPARRIRRPAAGTRVIPSSLKISTRHPHWYLPIPRTQDDQACLAEAAHGTFLLESATISSEASLPVGTLLIHRCGPPYRPSPPLMCRSLVMHFVMHPADGDPVEVIAKTLQMLCIHRARLPTSAAAHLRSLKWAYPDKCVRHWENLPNLPADDVVTRVGSTWFWTWPFTTTRTAPVLPVANAINFNGTSGTSTALRRCWVARLHSMLRRL